VSIDERIAKTIHASLTNASVLEADRAWDALPDAQRTPYRVAARRVLHELRTPTARMIADGNHGTARDAANVWERMIYGALHED